MNLKNLLPQPECLYLFTFSGAVVQIVAICYNLADFLLVRSILNKRMYTKMNIQRN